MSGFPSTYARADWFGPESFVTVVVGTFCIALPYVGSVPRSAGWVIAIPLVAGVLSLAASAVGTRFDGVLRRAAVGFVLSCAGWVLALLALVSGLAIGAAVG
ncbi:hypothetical protein ACWEKT_21145 [Nocardia takedensis]